MKIKCYMDEDKKRRLFSPILRLTEKELSLIFYSAFIMMGKRSEDVEESIFVINGIEQQEAKK